MLTVAEVLLAGEISPDLLQQLRLLELIGQLDLGYFQQLGLQASGFLLCWL